MPELVNEIPELIDPSITNKDVTLITIDKIIEDAGNDSDGKGEALESICLLLATLRNPFKASFLTMEIAKKYKWISKTMVSARVKELIKTLPKEIVDNEIIDCEVEEIPDDVNIRDVYKTGFYVSKGRYYFLTKDGSSKGIKGSNFIITPLFHIYSKTDNKRLVEIKNEDGLVKILDVQSKNMTSAELFFQSVYGEGNFVWHGNKYQWLKVLEHISREFPLCNELKTLGWQKEGFYAFANGIFSEKQWKPVDQFGITEHKGVKYFSPAFSTVYAGTRQDDDEYENDRSFIYRQSPIALNDWGKLMIEVYGDNAIIAVSYAITALFRDLIYEKHKCFPLLFMFGEKQSGKSQLAWSISNLFFDNLPGFNLNSGTQVGFHRRLARFRNTVAFFDEFTNDIPEARFQGLKSSFDGIGHEKGKATKDNRTEITKVNAACMPIGQYLPTRDDNALLTRAILLLFQKMRYSKEQTEKFERLKEYELHGLSSLLCDLLMYREDLEKRVIREYSEIMDKIKDDMISRNQAFDERLIRNYCSILSVVKIITSKIDIGFTYARAYEIAMERLPEQTLQISSSESLSNFWSMIEYLLDNKMIEEGKDFIIKNSFGENVVNSRNVQENIRFTTSKDLLFIRFSKIHPMYMEAHRKQFGKNGVDITSLMHYIKHHPSYIGYKDSYRFNHSVSSCYCFDYVGLNTNLYRMNMDQPEVKPAENDPGKDLDQPDSYDPVQEYNDKKAEQFPF